MCVWGGGEDEGCCVDSGLLYMQTISATSTHLVPLDCPKLWSSNIEGGCDWLLKWVWQLL